MVEDLIAAVDASARSAPGPDLRAVLLYGWAAGVHSADGIARRVALDPGLSYLLRGTHPGPDEIRAFRDQQGGQLEVLYTRVFALCQAAGLAALGDIWLGQSTGRPREVANGFAPWLAAYLMASSRAADARGGRRREPLPSWAATRDSRQAAFSAALGPSRPAPRSSPVRVHLGAAPRFAGVLALLVAGLLLVRWLSVVTAPPPTKATTARPPPLAAESVPPNRLPEPPRSEAPAAAAGNLELAAAHEEAMRLGLEALESDDLDTARGFYTLARAAAPDDEEAETRLRQVETALSIGERRDDVGAVLERPEVRGPYAAKLRYRE